MDRGGGLAGGRAGAGRRAAAAGDARGLDRGGSGSAARGRGTSGHASLASRAARLQQPVRTQVIPPENTSFGPFALSPDGRGLAFSGRSGTQIRLWIRPLDSFEARPLEGTEGALFPFWSPDGRSIGFFARGKLKRVDAGGGPPQTLCDVLFPYGGTWNEDGVIVFGPGPASPLSRVSVAGGACEPLTKQDPSRDEVGHSWPHFLPGGRHLLYRVWSVDPENTGIYLGSLDGRAKRLLLRTSSSAAYAPPGYLLFARENVLMAQPFHTGSLALSGAPFPVADQVAMDRSERAFFSVAPAGVLIYRRGAVTKGGQLAWFDRDGKPLGTLGAPGCLHPRLSPDGRRVALTIDDEKTGSLDTWRYDLARDAPTRLTFDPGSTIFPTWSPDGSRVAFATFRKGHANMYVKLASGAGQEESLLESDLSQVPMDWSRDGRFLLFIQTQLPAADIWVLPMEGERKPYPLVQTPFIESSPRFSPNGRWVAYVSNESGRYEVYVTPFAGSGVKWQVSTDGGRCPLWRGDGRELFFFSPDDRVLAVEVAESGSTLDLGPPRPLFQAPPLYGGSTVAAGSVHNVTADGRRFLLHLAKDEGPAPLHLVANWFAELGK